MITIDKVEDGFPVSVIIPLSSKRKKFFNQFVLPSIEAMNPAEIIVNEHAGTAPKKRNAGFDKSSQPFILFSDDDIVFPSDFLGKTMEALEQNPNKGYAYSGYYGIVMPNAVQHNSVPHNFTIPTINFDPYKLIYGNYISTMTLIRREHFPRFDESLKRFQDWDIWLTMLSKGVEGIAVHGIEYHAYFIDEGISSNKNSQEEAHKIISLKHKQLIHDYRSIKRL